MSNSIKIEDGTVNSSYTSYTITINFTNIIPKILMVAMIHPSISSFGFSYSDASFGMIVFLDDISIGKSTSIYCGINTVTTPLTNKSCKLTKDSDQSIRISEVISNSRYRYIGIQY